jgi:hypothetical protein
MNKIALINIQIGAYKPYFSLFLKSCENNSDVDFFFLTDQSVSSKCGNIHIMHTTFNEVKNRLQRLYEFPINLQSPYELCDYKVAYGELLRGELQNYDFWGFCDTDMVFGRIRNFLTESILDKYDKILIRGHFTLFRNNEKITSCYRMPLKNGRLRYKEVFSDAGVHHFDEGMPDLLEGINMIFAEQFGWERVYDKYIFMDLDVNKYQFINADFTNDETEQKKALHSVFLWNKGVLTRISVNAKGEKLNSEEFMYIHFQKRNMKMQCDGVGNSFYIVPNKFVTAEINKKLLFNANKSRIYWIKLVERLKKRIMK